MALLERFRAIVSQILRVDDTPHRLALTFAIGVFLGISPFIGLHTVLALAVAWIFRLNKVVILSGAFINNPWSFIPIYTFSTWIGTVILDTDLGIADVDWHNMTLGTFVSDLGELVIPFIVGTTMVGIFFSLVSYMVVRKTAEEYKSTSHGD
jgi:uncharacterized protein (DUF2062 family)